MLRKKERPRENSVSSVASSVAPASSEYWPLTNSKLYTLKGVFQGGGDKSDKSKDGGGVQTKTRRKFRISFEEALELPTAAAIAESWLHTIRPEKPFAVPTRQEMVGWSSKEWDEKKEREQLAWEAACLANRAIREENDYETAKECFLVAHELFPEKEMFLTEAEAARDTLEEMRCKKLSRECSIDKLYKLLRPISVVMPQKEYIGFMRKANLFDCKARIFQKMFETGQKTIERFRLAAGLAFLCKGTCDERLKLVWTLYDVNNMGTLSIKEFRRFFMAFLQCALKTVMCAKYYYTPGNLPLMENEEAPAVLEKQLEEGTLPFMTDAMKICETMIQHLAISGSDYGSGSSIAYHAFEAAFFNEPLFQQFLVGIDEEFEITENERSINVAFRQSYAKRSAQSKYAASPAGSRLAPGVISHGVTFVAMEFIAQEKQRLAAEAALRAEQEADEGSEGVDEGRDLQGKAEEAAPEKASPEKVDKKKAKNEHSRKHQKHAPGPRVSLESVGLSEKSDSEDCDFDATRRTKIHSMTRSNTRSGEALLSSMTWSDSDSEAASDLSDGDHKVERITKKKSRKAKMAGLKVVTSLSNHRSGSVPPSPASRAGTPKSVVGSPKASCGAASHHTPENPRLSEGKLKPLKNMRKNASMGSIVSTASTRLSWLSNSDQVLDMLDRIDQLDAAERNMNQGKKNATAPASPIHSGSTHSPNQLPPVSGRAKENPSFDPHVLDVDGPRGTNRRTEMSEDQKKATKQKEKVDEDNMVYDLVKGLESSHENFKKKKHDVTREVNRFQKDITMLKELGAVKVRSKKAWSLARVSVHMAFGESQGPELDHMEEILKKQATMGQLHKDGVSVTFGGDDDEETPVRILDGLPASPSPSRSSRRQNSFFFRETIKNLPSRNSGRNSNSSLASVASDAMRSVREVRTSTPDRRSSSSAS